MDEIDVAIAKANESLGKGVRCKINRTKDSLYLRATLPPKPGSGDRKKSQQRIATGLGATLRGVEWALIGAREVGLALDRGDFNWNKYLEEPAESIEEIAAQLEKAYFRERERTVNTETTWKKDYAFVYRRLVESGTELSLLGLRKFIKKYTEPNSSVRRRYLYACRRLANAANLVGEDLNDLVGIYTGKESPDELISDEEIYEGYGKLPNKEGRWIYGMLATFGLRNHEIFFCQFDEDNHLLCRVTEGKTGSRWAIPLYKEWAEEWQLSRMFVPNCTGKSYSDYGQRISGRFRRYVERNYIRTMPYELRRLWGRRFTRCGGTAAIGSQFMGNSEHVFSGHYQQQLDRQYALEQMMIIDGRGDRPSAPQ